MTWSTSSIPSPQPTLLTSATNNLNQRSPIKKTTSNSSNSSNFVKNAKTHQSYQSTKQNRQKAVNEARFSIPGVRLLGLRNAMSDERIVQVVQSLIERLGSNSPVELEVFVNLLDRFCDTDASPLRRRTILNFFQDASYNDDSCCSLLYESRFIETMLVFLEPSGSHSPAIATVIANLALENDLYRDCALHHGAFEAIMNCLTESGDVSHYEDIDVDEKDEDAIKRVSTFVWALSSFLNYEVVPPNIRMTKSFLNIAQDIINYGDWEYSDILISTLDGLLLLYEADSTFVRNEIRDVTLSQMCELFHRHYDNDVRESALKSLARITKVYLCESVSEQFESLLPTILHFAQNKRTCSSAWRLLRNVCCELDDSLIPWDEVRRIFVWTLENGNIKSVEQALKTLRENSGQLLSVLGDVLSSNWLEQILEVLIDLDDKNLSTFVTPHGVSIRYYDQTWFLPKHSGKCDVISSY